MLGHRLPNGFLGDYEPGAKSVSYYWYTSAYPIRTLLAGYQIFGEKKYLDAVLQILDKLVEEQMPNGAWQQTYRNKPTRDLSKAELEEIMQRHWMHLADIGSIVTALAISSRYAPPPRKENYIAAVRRYCDEWASRWQLPSGGFTNGMESGVSQTEVYSVATGTEAAAFAALYAVTKEEKYLEKAQRAAEFLIDNWRTDGRPVCYPHHSQNEGKMYVQPVTQFGDIFYYHDGILLVYYHSQDQNFRRKVEKAYGWYTKGERGLLSSIGQNPWWPLQDYWDNSKTAGIPLALLGYQRMGTDVAVDRAVNITKRFLCTPKFSQRIGVMVEDPPLPWGGHTLQSWAGCAIAATGFAGLSLAEMVQPGIIYLTPTK